MGNAQLRIYTFGRLSIQSGNQIWRKFRTDKGRALLIYLALSLEQTQRREHLATLFWPDASASAARSNLRVSIHDIRKQWTKLTGQSADALLTSNRQSVHLREGVVWSDVTHFQQLAASFDQHTHDDSLVCTDCITRRREAVALAQGELLSGFTFADAEAFNRWVITLRENVLQERIALLDALIAHYRQAAEWAQVVEFTRQLLTLEPWRESYWQQLFGALATQGDLHGVETAFAECQHFLFEELGVEPEPATVAAYEAARQRQQTAVAHLPRNLTPFFGRIQELTQLKILLTSGENRFITLVGAGGIGKSRLSITAAREVQAHFVHGVYFVPLASVEGNSPRQRVVTTIAETVDLSLAGNETAEGQLLTFLQDKSLLLVLDNWEHILPAAGLVRAIVSRAPNVVVLCTSREPLGDRAEYLLRIGGMSRQRDVGSQSASTQLFIDRAQRVGGRFAAVDERQISKICELVRGLPLAIELAASWVEHYTLAEIVAEIRDDSDFLTARRGQDERHGSMRQVFEQSWRLLSRQQRAALAQLAIFESPFDRKAARAVAEATPLLLSALVDKSLLRTVSAGRYALHPLVREFSAEKQQNPITLQHTHASYFAALLTNRVPPSYLDPFPPSAQTVTPMLPDLRAMWLWACEHSDTDIIERTIGPLYVFHYRMGRLQDARELLQAGFDQLGSDLPTLLLAKVASRLGAFKLYSGDVSGAHDDLRWSLAQFEQFGSQTEAMATRRLLISIYYHLGEFDPAFALATAQMEEAQANADRHQIASAANALGRIHNTLGNYVEAHHYYSLSAENDRQHNNQHSLAIKLANLGRNAMYAGNLADAHRYLQQSLTLRQQHNSPHRIASVQDALGELANVEGDYALAQSLHQQALTGHIESGRMESVGQSYLGLGRAALGLGDLATAHEQLQCALCDSLKRGLVTRALQSLNGWADYLIAIRCHDEAHTIKRYVANHCHAFAHTRAAAQSSLTSKPDRMVAKKWQVMVQTYCEQIV